MSSMSFMEKLLDGVEVEWKPLGEVVDVSHVATFQRLRIFGCRNCKNGQIIPILSDGMVLQALLRMDDNAKIEKREPNYFC